MSAGARLEREQEIGEFEVAAAALGGDLWILLLLLVCSMVSEGLS